MFRHSKQEWQAKLCSLCFAGLLSSIFLTFRFYCVSHSDWRTNDWIVSFFVTLSPWWLLKNTTHLTVLTSQHGILDHMRACVHQCVCMWALVNMHPADSKNHALPLKQAAISCCNGHSKMTPSCVMCESIMGFQIKINNHTHTPVFPYLWKTPP